MEKRRRNVCEEIEMAKSRSVEKERAQRTGQMYLSRVFQRLRRWTLAEWMSGVQVVNMIHWDCVGK